MSKSKSPRKKYKPKTLYYNNIDVAINRAALIGDSGKVQIQIINHAALLNLGQGKATLSDLKRLTAAINMSDAMQHIKLGTQYAEYVEIARHTILTIAGTQSEPYSASHAEMLSLRQWLELHDAQLDIASNGDILACQDLINSHIRSGNVDRVTVNNGDAP